MMSTKMKKKIGSPKIKAWYYCLVWCFSIGKHIPILKVICLYCQLHKPHIANEIKRKERLAIWVAV